MPFRELLSVLGCTFTQTSSPHTFHFRGAGRFLVLSRDGERESNLVWKDTVLLRAGRPWTLALRDEPWTVDGPLPHRQAHRDRDEVQLQRRALLRRRVGNAALEGWQIGWLVILALGWAATTLLLVVVISFVLIPVMAIVSVVPFVHAGYAAYRVSKGEEYRYPFVADLVASR